jgi:Rps23 Pro-64 3,4-dihydroxylase Tpa1-like proline 4-hydroxylase
MWVMWNPAIRCGELGAVFRERGFAVIDEALDPAAAEGVQAEIAATAAFQLVARSGVHPRRVVFDQPLSEPRLAVLRAQLAVAQRAGLMTALHDLWEPREDDPSSAIARLLADLRSPRTLAWIASVTSIPVDACQVRAVTRFRCGHYVDPHSDRLVKFGKRRRIAFVLFCSHDPSLRGGGDLVLMRRDGGIEASIEPRINRLALLDVDRIHQHFVPEIIEPRGERLAIPGFFCVTPASGPGSEGATA